MTVEQSKVVDFISITEKDEVVLTISDHLEWDGENHHLLLLQEKLNSYLRFIESGEIFESYPSAINRSIRINITLKYQPMGDGLEFLRRCKTTIHDAGFKLSWEIKPGRITD